MFLNDLDTVNFDDANRCYCALVLQTLRHFVQFSIAMPDVVLDEMQTLLFLKDDLVNFKQLGNDRAAVAGPSVGNPMFVVMVDGMNGLPMRSLIASPR